MREYFTYGSVRGAAGNGGPYRDPRRIRERVYSPGGRFHYAKEGKCRGPVSSSCRKTAERS